MGSSQKSVSRLCSAPQLLKIKPDAKAEHGRICSMAHGEANQQSDIDLIVEFSKRKSLLALVSLERKLSAALGRKVDLLTKEALSPYLHDRIMQNLLIIYEAQGNSL